MNLLGYLGNLILAYPVYVAATVAAVILYWAYLAHRQTVAFWVTDFRYRVPFFGKLAKLSRRITPAAEKDYSGWLQSEVTLGTDYKNHIHFLNQEDFDLYRLYLDRASDGGRTPLPFALMCVLVVLIAAEAFGFSYLVAGGLAHDMSANARMIGTVAIVIVLCIVLVLITHAAGHHLYRNLLIRQCRVRWDEATHKDAEGRKVALQTHRGINVKYGHVDDRKPEYSQCINRVDSHSTWWVVQLAAVIIVVFAGFQVALRVNDSILKTAQNTIGISDSANSPAMPHMPDFTSSQLPSMITQPQDSAYADGVRRLGTLEHENSWITSLALAFIYLITQGTSIYAGYNYGFAGEHSRECFLQTRGCKLYGTYMQKVEALIETSDRRMAALHQKIKDNIHNLDVSFGGSFIDFIRLYHTRMGAISQLTQRGRYGEGNTSPSGPRGNLATSASDRRSYEDLYERIRRMGEEEKQAYLDTLTADELEGVKSVVAARSSEQEQRRQQLRRELNDLV